MNYYIFTSNQTTHLSPRKFLLRSIKEYLIFHVIKSALIKLPLTTITHFKTVVSTKISISHNDLLKEKIVDFHPSILKDLLKNAIKFAKSIIPIDNTIIKTALHAHKLLLFNKNEVWVK